MTNLLRIYENFSHVYTFYTIFYKSKKRIMDSTSSNQAELVAMHQANWKCWMYLITSYIIQHMRELSKWQKSLEFLRVMFEDGKTWIKLLKEWYIKETHMNYNCRTSFKLMNFNLGWHGCIVISFI